MAVLDNLSTLNNQGDPIVKGSKHEETQTFYNYMEQLIHIKVSEAQGLDSNSPLNPEHETSLACRKIFGHQFKEISIAKCQLPIS
jgi:hypothetical protein